MNDVGLVFVRNIISVDLEVTVLQRCHSVGFQICQYSLLSHIRGVRTVGNGKFLAQAVLLRRSHHAALLVFHCAFARHVFRVDDLIWLQGDGRGYVGELTANHLGSYVLIIFNLQLGSFVLLIFVLFLHIDGRLSFGVCRGRNPCADSESRNTNTCALL